jgi:hypothetical protein
MHELDVHLMYRLPEQTASLEEALAEARKEAA